MTAQVKGVSLTKVYHMELDPPFLTTEAYGPSKGVPVSITAVTVKVDVDDDNYVHLEPYGYQLRKDGERKANGTFALRLLSMNDDLELAKLFAAYQNGPRGGE